MEMTVNVNLYYDSLKNEWQALLSMTYESGSVSCSGYGAYPQAAIQDGMSKLFNKRIFQATVS
jgi:hypothetical protein